MRTLMIDANIILRFLLRDHPGMYQAAAQLFEQAERKEHILFIDPLVIAECTSVMTGPVYRLPRADVARVLAEVLLLEGVQCDHPDRLTESLTLFAEQNVDFMDAYLACRSRDEEARLASFDRNFERLGSQVHVLQYEE